jgi:hypothetical protein
VKSDVDAFSERMAAMTIVPHEQAKDVSEAMTIMVTPGQSNHSTIGPNQ